MTKTGEMCFRFVLGLVFMCLADSDARVVKSFSDCSAYFFDRQWPILFKRNEIPPTYKYICQQYNFQTYFATLYMTDLRIPLFSAYRLDDFSCHGHQSPRRSTWFIEPQLHPDYNNTLSYNMRISDFWHNLGKYQAVNSDYPYTNYDRGHLNPRFYQCDDQSTSKFASTATFTLTNAVPQNPCFNRGKWWSLEQTSKQLMREECHLRYHQRFFVTGVVPSNQPQQWINNRVNVPRYIWTAACCYHSKSDSGFSFSYIGFNGPENNIEALTIRDLQNKLSNMGYQNVQIFSKGCFSSNISLFNVLDRIQQVIDRN